MLFKEMMESKGYDYYTLSEKLETDKYRIKDYCQGRVPRDSMLSRIAVVLGYPKDEVRLAMVQSKGRVLKQEKICEHCKKPYEARKDDQVFCGTVCRLNNRKGKVPVKKKGKNFKHHYSGFRVDQKEYTSDFIAQKTKEFLEKGGKVEKQKSVDFGYEMTNIARSISHLEAIFGDV